MFPANYFGLQKPAGEAMEAKLIPKSTVNLAKGPKLSSDLLRGHTETIVLGILHRGDAYGFEIYNTILERTGERYEIKETTLYSSYKRLEQDGCITSYWGDETQGARRRYYHLTGKGRETYRQNMEDWEFTRKILNNLMSIESSD